MRITRGLSASALSRLDDAMAAHLDKRELPGLVLLIARGEEVHVTALGHTAFTSSEPMQRETVFRVASLTKPVLAAAAMMLVEQGSLALEEPVDRLLPELANRRVLTRVDAPLHETVPAARPISVEHLLTSRMGFGILTEPTFDPPFPINHAAEELQLVLARPDPRTPHAPDAWIERFGRLPLMYQPGERWLYNASSLVLGVLVARAAGQPLEEVVRTRIFEPLGMSETGFWLSADKARQLPSSYMTNVETGQLEHIDASGPDVWSQPPAFPSGAGGLASTVDDYLQFARLLLAGGVHRGRRLLSQRSVELMTTNHLTEEQIARGGVILGGSGWGYGMGVVVGPDEVWPTPGRYGWAGGYGTAWFNDPGHNLVAMLMTQTTDVLFNGTLQEFSRLALEC
jgi:CubicO group peptidase (beta-lactamase class C family)